MIGLQCGAHFFSFFLYIASMRLVTRKPPKMFTEARIRATKPRTLEVQEALSDRRHRHRDQRADDDHRGDGVGHAHQRRVQRRRHAPDHEIADEDRQHEDRKPEDEGIDHLPSFYPFTLG